MRNLVTLFDVNADEIREILDLGAAIKDDLQKGIRKPLLQGHVLALLFEKQSLRTRVSFECGMSHLGGASLFLGQDVGWGQRESMEDFSRVLGQYVDVIACRAKAHDRVEELAKYSGRPVINALTDHSHPCQALADLLTLQEVHPGAKSLKLAYVGDANNVARSLAICCAQLGVAFAIASPEGYQFDDDLFDRIRKQAPAAELTATTDPAEAVKDAAAVYTDVWTSMGQEEEAAARRKVFAPFQVNEKLMALAPKSAKFLHCLPAKRGEEVTDGVIDSGQSIVVQQAGNRLHAQKGLLAWLFGKQA